MTQNIPVVPTKFNRHQLDAFEHHRQGMLAAFRALTETIPASDLMDEIKGTTNAMRGIVELGHV